MRIDQIIREFPNKFKWDLNIGVYLESADHPFIPHDFIGRLGRIVVSQGLFVTLSFWRRFLLARFLHSETRRRRRVLKNKEREEQVKRLLELKLKML